MRKVNNREQSSNMPSTDSSSFPRHPSARYSSPPLSEPYNPHLSQSFDTAPISNNNNFFNSDDSFNDFEQVNVPSFNQPLPPPQQQQFNPYQQPQHQQQQQQQSKGGWLSFFSSSQQPQQEFAQQQQPQSYEPIVDEVPLLEELGINFKDIYAKSVFVLNPLSKYRRLASQRNRASPVQSGDQDYLQHILDDMDLAGPLLFCLLLGFVLLLRGKVQFGYIYGVGVIGCISMYFLLNLMCPPQRHIEIQHTISILGYCLLPIVFLALICTFLPLWISMDVKLFGLIGFIVTNIAIVWSTWSAASMLVAALGMSHQKALVAYPVFLVYVTFALITVF
jgi:hypothetical protein